MAGLNELAPATQWTAAQTRAQFADIAWLRWRIFLNSFRRKGSTGELVSRIILFTFFTSFTLIVMVAAVAASYLFASRNSLQTIAFVLWGIFVLCQLLNIQLGQPGTTFDPTQLIRFPMKPGTYVAIRLCFGLLSPANIIAALTSFSVFIGVTAAIPSLWFYALVAMVLFALTNALFTRMVFAWVDRWLSTRRAREVFTGLIFVFSLGIQWANFTFNPAYGHHKSHQSANKVDIDARFHQANLLYDKIHHYAAVLPPYTVDKALIDAHTHNIVGFLANIAGCALFAAAFFAIFSWRTHTEFHGENLSDAANAVASARPPTKALHIPIAATTTREVTITTPQQRTKSFLSNQVMGVLGKEFLMVRRNTGIFYAMIAPMVFVLIFAGKLATRSNATWIFPAALAYTLMGVAPLSYNSFGLEGAGAQFYFMAPVRMRDVFLAKNLLNFFLAFIEIAAVFVIISFVATPPTITMSIAAFLWAAAALLTTTVFGNRRSITAPKKVNLGRTVSKQASPLSGLISFGVLIGATGIGGACLLLAMYLHATWILVPIFALLAAGAFALYVYNLGLLDRFTFEHREDLLLELCKPD